MTDPNVGYAFWDNFTDLQAGTGVLITNETPDATDSDYFTATFSGSLSGGGSVTGAGDRIYNGQGAGSVAFNLSIDGTVSSNIDTITLQIKMTSPDAGIGLTRETFFTVTLNGRTASVITQSGDTSETPGSGQYMGVAYYTWTDMNLTNGGIIDLDITSPASGHVSVDGVRLDASAVPEPSTYALIALGLGVIAWKARHRALRS